MGVLPTIFTSENILMLSYIGFSKCVKKYFDSNTGTCAASNNDKCMQIDYNYNMICHNISLRVHCVDLLSLNRSMSHFI